jgi:hypothetical protein
MVRKQTSPSSRTPPPPVLHYEQRKQTLVEFFTGYFWFIVKNVIGWIFILGAFPIGIALPGPGGIPLFLIGFALVTFPGKRRLTSRVMRGRPMNLEAEIFTFATAVASVLVTLALLWFISRYKYEPILERYHLKSAQLVGICLLALVVTWLVMRLALQIANWVIQNMPRVRRRVRPWLRKHGINLLPPRRKQLAAATTTTATTMTTTTQGAMNGSEEILEFSARHQDRLRWLWGAAKPWLKRAVGVAITVAIFAYILGPIFQKWTDVREHIWRTSPLRFAAASGMFAIFLFVFRALVWRRILQTFGHRLPVAAATRIWSTSELARYLPGAIWQVVGRVYLCKPYGVRGSVCSVTQILELAIFLLANVLVAVSCLLYFGFKNVHGAARWWLVAACALVPVLAFLLHPKTFYGIINHVMRRLNKPAIVRRLRGHELFALLAWNVLGLLWQSVALYLILKDPLYLKIQWWWVLAGAYSLAWVAGFLAVWAPGGIGVRELVFVTAMHVLLPDAVRQRFDDPKIFTGFLAFLSVLLRLWTVAGEIILAAIAYGLDLRGALGHPDAPGRMAIGSTTAEVDSAI